MERVFEFAVNHPFLVSLFFALLILLLWNLFGSAATGTGQVSPSEMTHLMNREHAMVVDIRNKEDFESGHILNAINIPEAEIADRKKELEKARNKPLVLYCQNGTTSPRVARQLKSDGFERVNSLNGGLTSWRNAGLPVSRGGA